MGADDKKKPEMKQSKGGRRGYRSKSGGARNEKNLVEVAVEAEFKTFMEGLKKKFGGNQLAYRMTNYPEGLEFSFRIAKKSGTEGDKFTSSFSQKGKKAEKRARKLEKQRLRKEKREKENQSPNIKREEKASSESDAKEKESEKDNLNEKVIASFFG